MAPCRVVQIPRVPAERWTSPPSPGRKLAVSLEDEYKRVPSLTMRPALTSTSPPKQTLFLELSTA